MSWPKQIKRTYPSPIVNDVWTRKSAVFGTCSMALELYDRDSYFTDNTFATLQRVASGAVGGLLDSSGSGNHPTQNTGGNRGTLEYNQGEIADRNGIKCPALKLLRASSQYYNLPSPVQSDQGAIIMAIKNTGLTGNQALTGGPAGTSFTVRIVADGRITVDQSATVNLLISVAVIPENTWITVCWTGSKAGNEFQLYVDGVPWFGSSAYQPIGLWGGGTQTFLGAEPGPANYSNILVGCKRQYTGTHWSPRMVQWQHNNILTLMRNVKP